MARRTARVLWESRVRGPSATSRGHAVGHALWAAHAYRYSRGAGRGMAYASQWQLTMHCGRSGGSWPSSAYSVPRPRILQRYAAGGPGPQLSSLRFIVIDRPTDPCELAAAPMSMSVYNRISGSMGLGGPFVHTP